MCKGICENTPKNHFIYVNKEIYCIFKMCCIICFIFYKMPFISYFFFLLLLQ
jgi:hypothetical protein